VAEDDCSFRRRQQNATALITATKPMTAPTEMPIARPTSAPLDVDWRGWMSGM